MNAGIQRVPRTAGVKDGRPLLTDGQTLDVQNVIWCTGYEPSFPWIDLPITGADGEPAHQGGVVQGFPGLYFVGLHFLYAMSSATLIGIGRDAKRVVKALASRVRQVANEGEAQFDSAEAQELADELAPAENARIA